MMAGSHVALGAAAWLVAAPALGQPALTPAAFALAIAGSLAPDLDHPKSWLGRRIRPLSAALSKIFGHRGVTHSAMAVAGCAWLLLRSGLPAWAIAPFVVGYLSHLAADLLTPAGLRLAWPLRGTWSLPLCRTGSPFEPLVVAVLLCVAWNGTDATAQARDALRGAGVCRLGVPLGELCPVRVARR